jgi:hypothetical protein
MCLTKDHHHLQLVRGGSRGVEGRREEDSRSRGQKGAHGANTEEKETW